MKTLVLLTTLTLMALTCACGCKGDDDTAEASATPALVPMPEEMRPYYDAYQSDVMLDLRLAGLHPAALAGIVWIKDIPDTTHPDRVIYAECVTAQRRVYLNKKATESFTAAEFKALVFHELTHCIYTLPQHDTRPDLIFSEQFHPEKAVKDWTKQVDTLIQYIETHAN